MRKLTKDELEAVLHIPIEEVIQDRDNTKLDVERLKSELYGLHESGGSRLDIFMNNTLITQGEDLIEALNQIIEYRKSNSHE